MDADFNPLLIVSCGFLIRVYPCASVVEVCPCFPMLDTIYAILSLTSGARPDATNDLRIMVLSVNKGHAFLRDLCALCG